MGSKPLYSEIYIYIYIYIKYEFHGTIYIFKNYFVTIFSVFNKISGIQTDSESSVITIVLKIGPDRPIRPVQPGTESKSGPVKRPKTGQQLENQPKTSKKPGLNRKFKKNGSMPGSIFKTMVITDLKFKLVSKK